jgi:hypothetical protein
VIATQTSRDLGLAKRCLNHADVKNLNKVNCKSKANTLYNSSDFQEPKMLLDNGFPRLDEGIDNAAIGVKCYWGSQIPLGYFPGITNRNNANRLHTISSSVPPADDGLLPADNGISIPPSSPDKGKMLPAPAPSANRKE